MKIDCIKIRWIVDQCYEIVLPNGKHIMIDPEYKHLLELKEPIERIDYVFITHSHYASASGIGYLCTKYGAKLFIGDMTASLMAEYFDLDYSLLYPMSHMQTFDLEDFTLTCYKGKHAGSGIYRDKLMTLSKDTTGYGELDVRGIIESFDFCITFCNNIKLMMVSGFDLNRNIYSIAEEFRPDIIFRQAVRGWTPEYYANAVSLYKCQLVFLGHHDKVYRGDAGKIAEFVEAVRQKLKMCGSNTELVSPVSGVWYCIVMSMQLEQ